MSNVNYYDQVSNLVPHLSLFQCQRLIAELGAMNERIAIIRKTGGLYRRYPLSQVVYFYAESKYVMAKMDDGADVLVHKINRIDASVVVSSIRFLVGFLESAGISRFVISSRGCLIDKHKIDAWEKGTLLMRGGSCPPVSRRYQSVIRKLISEVA